MTPQQIMHEILGIGTDIVEIKRILKAIDRHGKRFLERIFTPKEQHYCFQHRRFPDHFAARWAGKEAVVKAFGGGFQQEISWLDIEICRDHTGKPHVVLSNKLNELFHTPLILITLSHSREYASAFAIYGN